ncbi:GGDEF domain-containing protein [Paenibacillus sp. M1]|uniref:GGDEF domain-containing protein n=1 Tax=Paenibacillus haidiansis TaxID=1574488 RepID=A0ABU7VVF7_9BACL
MIQTIFLNVSMIFLTMFLFYQLYFKYCEHWKSNIAKQLVLGIGFGLVQYIYYQFPINLPGTHTSIFMGGTTFITAAVFGGGIAAFTASSFQSVIQWLMDEVPDLPNRFGRPHGRSNGGDFAPPPDPGSIGFGPTSLEGSPLFNFHMLGLMGFTVLVVIAFWLLPWKKWKIWLLLNVLYQIYLFMMQNGDLSSTFVRTAIELTGASLIGFFIMYMYNANDSMKRLKQNALTDSLTGLYNVRYFDYIFPKMISDTERRKSGLALIIVDLDHFKSINDTYGHPSGDRVLTELAGLLKGHFKSFKAVVSRNGGEEFTILIPHKNRQSVIEEAERLREKIEAHPFTTAENSEPLMLTISAGLAFYSPKCQSRKTMYESADQALYKAKEAGRNKIRIA